MFEKNNKSDENVSLSAGKLLLAEPFMDDPYFKRSVVLLCRNDKDGVFGLILNRPLDIKLSDAIDDLDFFAAPLFYGGPVATEDTMHFLHRCGDLIADSQPIADGIFWGGDFEQVKDLIIEERLKPTDIRFYLGYAGWGSEQLAEEVSENSWIIGEPKAADVFDVASDGLWQHILTEMGGKYKIIANYPENPMLN